MGGRVRPVNRDRMTAPPSTVAQFLERAELSQYAEAFELQGWDSLPQLVKITPQDLAILITDVKMKSGHIRRLHAALGVVAAPAAEVAAATAAPGMAPSAGPAEPSAGGAQEPQHAPAPARDMDPALQTNFYNQLKETNANTLTCRDTSSQSAY